MKKKHPKALTATRVRYRVIPLSGRKRLFPRKAQALRYAEKNAPAKVVDRMARIGAWHEWEIYMSGAKLVKRRT